jgi:hypothetical protein
VILPKFAIFYAVLLVEDRFLEFDLGPFKRALLGRQNYGIYRLGKGAKPKKSGPISELILAQSGT